jgi:hypothetical protein
MKITENYVRKTIEEVAPLVEKISGLECDFYEYKINQKDIPLGVIMNYDSKAKEFGLRKKFGEGNEDFFKICIGHELVHNAQYSKFPDLIEKLKEGFYYQLNNLILGDSESNLFRAERKNPVRKLIEGDASLIERELNIKYFPKAKRHTFFGIVKSPLKSGSKSYKHWANTLQKKFNGNRDKINQLYKAPIEELDKIFNSD